MSNAEQDSDSNTTFRHTRRPTLGSAANDGFTQPISLANDSPADLESDQAFLDALTNDPATITPEARLLFPIDFESGPDSESTSSSVIEPLLVQASSPGWIEEAAGNPNAIVDAFDVVALDRETAVNVLRAAYFTPWIGPAFLLYDDLRSISHCLRRLERWFQEVEFIDLWELRVPALDVAAREMDVCFEDMVRLSLKMSTAWNFMVETGDNGIDLEDMHVMVQILSGLLERMDELDDAFDRVCSAAEECVLERARRRVTATETAAADEATDGQVTS